ncbi:MAG TPA: hypothetical protein VNN77_05905 [candidate division Zixibacteria bacterium]|nr:hypothetical protein [candidate division Zixibacteria bacterium]
MKGQTAKRLLFPALVAAFVFLVYTQVTFFVIPPLGAPPKGKTLVVWRYAIKDSGRLSGVKLRFVDSPDAACIRITGDVNLACRSMALATVANNSTVLFSLPYFQFLHAIAE